MPQVSRTSGLKSLATMGIVVALTFVGGSAAHAESPPRDVSDATHLNASAEARTDSRLSQIVEHVSTSGGVAQLDYAAAAGAGIDAEYLNAFAEDFAGAGGRIDGSTAFTSDKEHAVLFASCVGRNSAWTDGWGLHIEMDTCKSQQIIHYLNGNALTGGVVVAILAPVPGVNAATLAAIGAPGLLMGIGAWALDGCQYHNGVLVGATVHLTGFPWCGAQS